jgi:hypothetical protein
VQDSFPRLILLVKETDTQAAYYPGYNVAMIIRRHPHSAPRKPQGQPTRGKTAQNRLRRVDLFFARYDPALLRRTSTPDPTADLAPDLTISAGGAAWRAEALVFSTHFRLGFEPTLFQPVLPKSYIHRMLPGEPVYPLMEAWKRAAQRTQPERAWGLRRWFVAAAQALAGEGYAVQLLGRWPELGFLIVRLTAL